MTSGHSFERIALELVSGQVTDIRCVSWNEGLANIVW
jgi:hypothetical protein